MRVSIPCVVLPIIAAVIYYSTPDEALEEDQEHQEHTQGRPAGDASSALRMKAVSEKTEAVDRGESKAKQTESPELVQPLAPRRLANAAQAPKPGTSTGSLQDLRDASTAADARLSQLDSALAEEAAALEALRT